MGEPPELWAFAVANLFMFGFGATLTSLSYYAYRTRERRPSFRLSTIGFGLITFGGLAEPVYQLGLKGDYHLSGRELLALQTAEGLLVAIGLGLLFLSIYTHNVASRSTAIGQFESQAESR